MSDSRADNGLASYVMEHQGKMKRFHFWLDVDRRIKKLEETNRLLCRDLDESQKANEVLRGIRVDE